MKAIMHEKNPDILSFLDLGQGTEGIAIPIPFNTRLSDSYYPACK